MNLPQARLSRRETLGADALLALATLIWGTTFPINKQLLQHLPPFGYMWVRAGVATVALAILARGKLLRLGRDGWARALLLSVILFAGFAFQMFGLRLTTPTKSAFLTCVSVPLVPFVGLWLLRSRPNVQAWIGCGLAFAGSLVLTYQPGILIGTGDLLTLVCAVCFALQIVLVSRFMPGRDPAAMTAAVLLFNVPLGAAAAVVAGEPALSFPTLPWGTMLWLGVMASAATLLIQSWAQKHTPAVHAAIVFTLEPVFAALFSYLWMGERLGPRTIAGSVFILAGIVVAEL